MAAAGPSSEFTSVAEPLYQVKLLTALRNGDRSQILQLLTEIGKDKRRESNDHVDVGAAAVHLAIRCASCDTIGLLLSHRSISPNAVYPSGSGTTPLHLAASIGRADVVNLLLDQEGIDDTARDTHGRTCKDVARGKEVQKSLRDSRALLTASFRSLLHAYIHSQSGDGPPQQLLSLLSSPRARLIDLSYLDPTSGRSLLHEAGRRKDLRLIDLSIRAGADVFVRDRKGKGVAESSKDEKVKVFFKQFTNQDTSLLDTPSTDGAPTMRGYLNKYTNVAKGYGTRWFVLKNGILSYFRHQEDEGVASRGSISMKSAVLKYNASSSTDRLRFEIHSTPSRMGSSSQQKWYMKGNHAGEVSRWAQAIARNIEFYKGDTQSSTSGGGGHSGYESDGRSLRSFASGLRAIPGSISSSSPFKRSSASISKISPSSASSIMESKDGAGDGAGTSNLRSNVVTGEELDAEEGDGEGEDAYSSDSRSQVSRPPHELSFVLHGNSAAAQTELTSQLISAFNLPANSSQSLREVQAAIIESADGAQRMVSEYVRMVQEREEWWREKLERERERGALWEESLQVVVQEGAQLESELKSRMRQRGSRIEGTTTDAGVTTPRKSSVPASSLFTSVGTLDASQEMSTSGLPMSPPPASAASSPRVPLLRSPSATVMTSPGVADAETTDEEDEFFDAIESNTLPNVVVPSAFVEPPEVKPPIDKSMTMDQYAGYANLRSRLPIEKDTRPPTSLWSVLKHSIGKDLTKISFPVFFNEPTSMLQRMAEDMEFSECLDAAAVEPDPLKRIAFVAAFAMSNYSSTIGRIAKPFNPMLSETFEYVRLDKKYRYMSEQVSHHPPISACWAESPLWHYFGEVDAQNKFMGKSFEIRPTGVAHAELNIPKSFGPNYPKATGKWANDKVVEHYSWKKVTTNVSGFILGSPTIDHYGDMIVTNHRTDDTCILTFKPRGWRGKDAYEILGRVMDASNNVVYEIAGRWNSQLVARATGTGMGALHPDVSIGSPSSSTGTPEFNLLWRNTEKPTAPFNLTPFAITLNDLPEDTLKPYVCPTDCRFRPDQRAFEIGRYERANELKGKQEDFQRATRRAREEGRLPAHRPRWFEAKTERDTGERVWEPLRSAEGDLAYWKEREAVWKEGKAWTEVEKIFIDDEP